MQTVSHRPFVHDRVHGVGVGVDNRLSPDHVVNVPRDKMVYGRWYNQGHGYAYAYAYAYGHEFADRDTAGHESGMDIHGGVGGAAGSYNEDDNECVAVVHHDCHHPRLLLLTMVIPALWCDGLDGHGGVGTADHAGTHGSAHDA